jgi:hypothetical protein
MQSVQQNAAGGLGCTEILRAILRQLDSAATTKRGPPSIDTGCAGMIRNGAAERCREFEGVPQFFPSLSSPKNGGQGVESESRDYEQCRWQVRPGARHPRIP